MVDRQQWRYAQHIDQWSNRLLMEREIRDKIDTGITVSMELSAKRQSFCRYIANGFNPTEAYRKAFNVTSERKSTATEAASRLMKDSNVTAMIQTLQTDIRDKVVWDKAEIMNQLSINVEASRNVNQFAASNRSIELLGKAIGNVFEPETIAVSGTVSVIHSLSDAQLDQLAALASEPLAIDDSEAIEAESYQLLDTESE